MPPTRLTIAPSNTAGLLDGTDVLESINTEVDGLWQYALVPLTSLAGINAITGSCVVPIAANKVGHQFSFLPPAVNTGNVSLDVDTRGALPVRTASGDELPSGYLSPSRLEAVINMGSEYRLTIANAGAAGTTTLRAVIARQLASGTGGGSTTSGSRQRYPFNTVISNNIPGLTLDTVTNIGRISVPARPYERIEASCAFTGSGNVGLYLRNITDAADVPEQVMAPGRNDAFAKLAVRTVLAATKLIELQYRSTGSQSTTGLGAPVSDAVQPERFGFIEFISYG